MRKVLIEKEVFKFEELSKESQNKVISNKMEWQQDNFEMDVENFLADNFPNSELKYQYSLNSCQSDGFNFYGKIDVKDIVKNIFISPSDIELLEEIEPYLNFEKKENKHYCYSMTFSDYFNIDNILSNIEYDYNVDSELFNYSFKIYEIVLNKILNRLREFFNKEEKNFENLGYDIIYPSIESCIKDGAFDDYEFFENGDIFDECNEYERKV